jgi:hypothetical protein
MRALPVVFAGSAEELRLHSRRDLLINIALGGLYTSIARRHRAQYLESRTTIDGTPLAHVPVAKSRWPAIVLAVAFVALRLANQFGEGPPLPLIVLAGVLLLPYLWGTVTARTIAAIRWREMPLGFTARWREVYAASWPLLLLGAAWALLEPKVAAIAESGSVDARVYAGTAVAVLVGLPLLAAQAFHWKRLRFTRTRVGSLAVTWSAGFGAYLRLWSLTALAVLLTAVAPVLLLRHALFGTMGLQDLLQVQDSRAAPALAVYTASLLLIVLLSSPARAWYEAKAFVLAWNGVRAGDELRVACALDPRAFVRMRTADGWRTLRTLGRHHPHAVVNAYRAKLAALRVLQATAAPRQ